MTEKLFYQDSLLFSFSARVLTCVPDGERWRIILDRTAFFPEGGGQPGDRGTLGGTEVLDTREQDGEIVHFCLGPLEPGAEVEGQVDRELRLARMQNHSGEHILSGTAHRLYGCENVGFHMGGSDVTIDFDRELSMEQLKEIETLANEAVWENLPVRTWYPDAQTLASLEYRSKKELTGDVRIVEIPGVDRCACCAPHVPSTGMVGGIKILSAERHRGGVRLIVACGRWAFADYRRKQQSAAEISVALSVKRDEISGAVQKLLADREGWKQRYAALSMELVRMKAEQQPATDGNLCLFETVSDEVAVRELVNLLVPRCSGLAAVFFPGADGRRRYIIGSRSVDLRANAKRLNAGIGGRGGGSPEMIQGSAEKPEEKIREFLLGFSAQS